MELKRFFRLMVSLLVAVNSCVVTDSSHRRCCTGILLGRIFSMYDFH